VLVNNSRIKADETYVDFDQEGFSDVPIRLELGAFEALLAPGKHDGARVVQRVLELYESSSVLV
jgi:hypothetical protein